jgi:hypothetical protein
MATSLASTSGTVGQTVLTVTSIIEHAVRRCGVMASLITAEQQESARDNLFLILSSLAARGLSLWCVSQTSLLLRPGQATYLMPAGTVDVLNSTLNPGTTVFGTFVPPGPSAPFGAVEVTLENPARLDFVSVLTAATQLVTIEYEIILDLSGVPTPSWVPVETFSSNKFDAANIEYNTKRVSRQKFAPSASRWRIKAVDGSGGISLGYFTFDTKDIVVSKLNRDAYASMPDKYARTARPLQLWYDKQQAQPQVTFWPIPSETCVATFFTQRQIQDPGAYTNAVEVPQRWLDAVISLLAPRVCLELPKELVPPDRYNILVGIADKTLREAEDSETDGAPVMLAPNISCYTR